MTRDDAHKVKWIEVYIEDNTKADGYRIEHYDNVYWWIEDEHLCIGGCGTHITRYPDIAYDKFTVRER